MIKKQYPLDPATYDFKIRTDVQLRFNDIDGYGHANNSSLQAFFDLGRSDYLKAICGEDFYEQERVLLVVSYATDFYKQVRFTDRIEVRTATYRIGNKSIGMLMTIVNKETEEICVVCDSVMAGYDKAADASCAVSPEWREKIAALEGHSF